ncbi:hypothetical protein ZOSMA_202G00040 [Zostera marina]|uniref:Uncharacterized protein n=1 Tax=Zostera marina TaxID=29655 RepID=A0A0K9PLI0_ZOSMR|nr:hypothetical protein ZOSMA_202G00040 [Zostera marina]
MVKNGSSDIENPSKKSVTCNLSRRCIAEDKITDDAPEKILVKVVSADFDLKNLPFSASTQSNTFTTVSTTEKTVVDRSKILISLFKINHPKKVFLIFSIISSMGIMIIIYLTLNLNQIERL